MTQYQGKRTRARSGFANAIVVSLAETGNKLPLLLLILPVLSTLAGGLLALRFRRSLGLLSALGAGLLLGAAFLDLLPEAVSIGESAHFTIAGVLGLTLLSFLLFFGLQSLLDSLAARPNAPYRNLGSIGGSLLIFHSFRDGMAIGLAYAASHPAGYAVAAGIAAHDLADGLNTVILTTGGKEARRSDYIFLALDCVAPLAGGLLTVWWSFSAQSSVVLLAAAAGFFLQLATSDFLPEARRRQSSQKLLLPAVLCGSALIYIANRLLSRAL